MEIDFLYLLKNTYWKVKKIGIFLMFLFLYFKIGFCFNISNLNFDVFEALQYVENKIRNLENILYIYDLK